MLVFSIEAPAQMLGMVVRPGYGRPITPMQVQAQRRDERGPGNRYGNEGRIFVRPPQAGNHVDTVVAQVMTAHAQALSCDRGFSQDLAGQAYRNLQELRQAVLR